MSISAVKELSPNRLERDELEVLQRRALRSWRNSDWLATHNPKAWDALGDFPDEVWLDVGGGQGESQQTPGAIVLGYGGLGVERTAEHRGPDLEWSLANGVPAADATLDRVIVPEGTLRTKSIAEQDFILRDLARSLRVGGLLILREDASLLAAWRSILDDLGFELDAVSRRADRDNEHTYVLTKKTIDSLNLGDSLLRETVLGDTRLSPVRRPQQ